MSPRLMLATLCLNEMEHLPNLYQQHRDWPGLEKWVFVESADRMYAEANPKMVTDCGLSVDGTSDWLANLASLDSRAVYIPYGFSRHRDPAQGKVQSRQQYINIAHDIKPDFIFCVDADEFYTFYHQRRINEIMESHTHHNAFRFRQHEVWRPPSIRNLPLFTYEAIGGFWDVRHTRGWRYLPRMRYARNHNHPEVDGVSLTRRLRRMEKYNQDDVPVCVHLAFASLGRMRHAKHNYYVARGEGDGDGRQKYVDSRRAFETWQPGDELPHGGEVIPYRGPVPEVFQRTVYQVTAGGVE